MSRHWSFVGGSLVAVTLAGALFALFLSGGAVHAVESNAAAVAQATQAAEGWMKLVDDGEYKQSWESASSLFKAAITDDQWEQRVAAVRQPLGKVTVRKLKSTHYATSLLGAPAASTSSSGTPLPFKTRNPRSKS